MSKVLVFLINKYQKLAPFHQRHCVFYPTCSEYTKQSLVKYGFFKGLLKGIRRILRCHPWQTNHFDPVV